MTDSITFTTESGSVYTITNIEKDLNGEFTGHLTRQSEADVYSYRSGAYSNEEFGDDVRFFFMPIEDFSFSFFHPEHGGCHTTAVITIKETA